MLSLDIDPFFIMSGWAFIIAAHLLLFIIASCDIALHLFIVAICDFDMCMEPDDMELDDDMEPFDMVSVWA